MRNEEARIVIDALEKAADVIKRADMSLCQLYNTDNEGSKELSGFIPLLYMRINKIATEQWEQEERDNER